MTKQKRVRSARATQSPRLRNSVPPSQPKASSSPSVGATPSFRGYRHQCLYTLHRVLTMAGDASVHPEGIEDLAIFSDAQLAEVCQVKSVGAPLAVHHLRSSTGSFFARSAAVLRTDPTAVLRIVSFGPVGPELAKAIAGGPEREQVVRKLVGGGFASAEELRNVLSRLVPVEEVSELRLTQDVESLVAQLVTGIDAKTSVDLLMLWIYRAAEEKKPLSRSRVEREITDVGRYLAERRDHQAEWFTTVEPLADEVIAEARVAELTREFHRGMQARWEHVLAGVTVARPDLLRRVAEAMAANRVAVLHGASGQGKSTLAYQYMRELPEVWRFRVRRIDDREHAARLASLLASFGRTLDLPVFILIDVQPSDAAWPELVARLYEQPNVHVLVAIREEDWRRTEPSRAAFDFVEIGLHELERSDAAEIYAGLDPAVRSPEMLDFEDAWAQFGGVGPLLEFVHLVTQGSTLRDVLRKQVERLQDEVRAGTRPRQELELLRLVAVASSYGARLRLSEVVAALSLASPARTVDLLEREYLVRIEDGGAAIAGLHPVRSELLADLLTDDILAPWIQTAKACLSLMYEEDLEAFLLHGFSRRPRSRQALRDAATLLVPRTWRAIAGVGRALVWLGVAEYAEANRSLFDRLYDEHGEAWSFLVDSDIAGAMPGMADELVDTIGKTRGEAYKAAVASARKEQRPVEEVWAPLKGWLDACVQPRQQPSGGEWSDVGQVLFWAGHLRIARSFDGWLNDDTVSAAWSDAPLRAIADLMLGCHAHGSRHLRTLQAGRDATTRLYSELLVVRLVDDGSCVTAHFVVPIDAPSPPGTETGSDQLHAFTMERVELLRGLWPERNEWGTQGYGHRIMSGLAGDSTTKRIPRRSFPIRWLTSTNGLLAGYESLRRRPNDWSAYRETLAKKRSAALGAITLIVEGLRRYHRSESDRVVGYSLDAERVDQLRAVAVSSLALPRTAVDEWGLMTESSAERADAQDQQRRLALRRYDELVHAVRDWSTSVDNALRQAPLCLAVEPVLARRAHSDAERDLVRQQATSAGVALGLGPLASLNIRDAYWRLGGLGVAVARLFSASAPSSLTAANARAELTEYLRLAIVWEQFLARPGRRIVDALVEGEQHRMKRQRQLVRDIDQLTSDDHAHRCRVLSSDLDWDDGPALFVAIDSLSDPVGQLTAAEVLIDGVRSLLRGESVLAGHLTAIEYRNVVFILLARGQMVSREAFVFGVLGLQQDRELKPIDFVPKALPVDTAKALGLAEPLDPMLREADLLLRSVAQLWALTAHCADVLTLGEADDAAEPSLVAYFDRVASKWSDTFNEAIDRRRRLADWSATETTAAGGDIAAALEEIRPLLLPVGFVAEQKGIRLGDLARSTSRLETARSLAVLVRGAMAFIAADSTAARTGQT
jgi:hypothetical protein